MGNSRHLLPLLLASCSAPTPNEPIAPRWLFSVTLGRDAEELTVLATLPPGPALDLTVAPSGVPFLTDIQVEANGSMQAAVFVDETLHLAAAGTSRLLRWRFRARAASTAIDDIDLAAWRGRGFMGSLAAFLPQPVEASPDLGFDLSVDSPPSLAFACVGERTADGWRGALNELPMLPACTFGAIVVRALPLGEQLDAPRIDVVELSPRPARYAEALDEWVLDAARAITPFFGKFPVDSLLLVVASGRHPGISGGTARGLGVARIFVDVPPRFGKEQ
ncbi:MAG: hypothetical protein ABIP94_17945, partial [Planctomycetota bacterium]